MEIYQVIVINISAKVETTLSIEVDEAETTEKFLFGNMPT